MGCSESSGASASRQPLRISIADVHEALVGLREVTCCVKACPELGAVELRVAEGPTLVFSQAATVDLILRLIAAFRRLKDWGEGDV